jgi:ABC-type phosphate transport system ATPase subunit
MHAQIEAMFYGEFLALKNVNLDVHKNAITAFIGPSGCRTGELVEYDRTETIFNHPKQEVTRRYVQGRFG